MSHNIDKVLKPKPTYHCQEEKDKGKVAVLTQQYNELLSETKAARDAAIAAHDYWQQKAAALEGLALEVNATANKQEILAKIAEVKAAVASIDPYVVLSDDEMDAIFEDESE